MFFLEFHKAQFLESWTSPVPHLHQRPSIQCQVNRKAVCRRYHRIPEGADRDRGRYPPRRLGWPPLCGWWNSTLTSANSSELLTNGNLNGKSYLQLTCEVPRSDRWPQLSWNENINLTCRKANGALALLRRNMSGYLVKMKTRCYQSMVRLIMEYASTGWDPLTKISIHRQAARFVSRQYSWYLRVTPMLQALRWTSLEQRRSDARATMMYRKHYNLFNISAVIYLQLNIRDMRGHQLKYQLPASTVFAHRHSFFPATVRIWNALPSHVVLAPSLESLRTNLVSSR